MKIGVKVKAGAKESKIVPPPLRLIKTDESLEYFTVFVKEPPVHGKANDAVIKLLAKYFSTISKNVKLVRGATSKTKIFEILQ